MAFFSRIYHTLFPKGILARFTLIICMPMIICQLIGVYLFYERHWNNVSIQTSAKLTSEIEIVMAEYSHGNQMDTARLSRIFDFKFENIDRIPSLTVTPHRIELNILSQALKKAFKSFVSLKHDVTNNKILIYFDKGNEDILKVTIPSKPLINPSAEIYVAWMLGISILFLVISMIFAKNQIRSIEELSKAANNFGAVGAEPFVFKPSGASEIRKAGIAFLKMQDRLERQVKKRLQMLAMISHDLRTPLTRMLLQLELSKKSKDNEMLKQDAESMKHMIDSYLDFARGEEGEEFVTVEIKKWLKEFFEHSRFKNTKLMLGKHELYAEIKPLAFMRALANIISNAEKYSKNSDFSYCQSGDKIYFTLEDDGPGIKDEEKNLVFKTFYRSDKARRIDQYGSVGLGLPIAKEIILRHKGEIKIEDSTKLGGAKIVVTIPVTKYT